MSREEGTDDRVTNFGHNWSVWVPNFVWFIDFVRKNGATHARFSKIVFTFPVELYIDNTLYSRSKGNAYA